ncbi:MAG: MFS transporter [Caldilineaceae bacterium]
MATTTLTQTVRSEARSDTNWIALVGVVLGHLSVDMQTGSLTVLLPMLLATFSLDYTSAAAIMSLNSIVIAVTQPLFGVLGDQRQMRWLVYVGCLLCGVAMISVLYLPSYWLVLVAVVASGIGSAMFHPEALSVVRAISGKKTAAASSFFFFGGNLGFALGPLLIAWITHQWGIGAALWMIVPTILGLTALLYQSQAINKPAYAATISGIQEKLGQGRTTHTNLVLLLLALIAVHTTVLTGLKTFIPLYYEKFSDLGLDRIALMVTVISLTGALGTLAGGFLAERIGRRTVILVASVLVMGALFVFWRTDGWLQLLTLALVGTFLSMPWPICVVMVQEAMPNNVGLASGLTLGLAYGVSGLAVAALGRMADVVGLPATMQLVLWIPLAAIPLSFFVPERVE